MFKTRANTRYLSLLVLLSGIPALGYQLIWSRMFAVALGHELPAAMAVVAAYFGGLALGAFLFDRIISTSEHPATWYGALELSIGIAALVSMVGVEWARDAASSLIGPTPGPLRYWTIAFTIPFLTLLPATAAMGGTLVAADRWLGSITTNSRRLGKLYALNTFGAALGIVLTSLFLMPEFGFRKSLLVLATINISIALAVFAYRTPKVLSNDASPDNGKQSDRHEVAIALMLCGFLGIGYEVAVVRIMAQILEGTLYSFAAVLLVYLVGTAVGAAVYQRFLSHRDSSKVRSWLAVTAAGACTIGIGVLFHGGEVYRSLRRALGDSVYAVSAAEMLIAIPVFLLPTMMMGGLFCHFAESSRHARGGIGWALGMNTTGGVLAPAVVGIVLVPTFGAKWATAFLAWGYLLLIPRPWPLPRWLPVLPIALTFVLPPDLKLVTLRENERMLEYRQGTLASVAVTERPRERNLRVNNRFQMGGTGRVALRIQRMQAHLPLLLHPQPRDVLFLGVASGITAGAALAHPDVSVSAIELVPETLGVLDRFAAYNKRLKESPRAHLHVGDARRFVRETPHKFDVVVGDLFHPARDGAALMFTQEHFEAIRARLRPNGVYSQWLPLYQMDAELLRMILRTFASTFSHVETWIASYDEYPALALVGSQTPLTWSEDRVARSLDANTELRTQLAASAIREPQQLAFHFLADASALNRFMGDGPLNLDDHPRVLFDAPAFTYERGKPLDRTLRVLVNETRNHMSPKRLAKRFGSKDTELQNGFASRNRFLETYLLRAELTIEEQTQGYINAAALSADFTLATAYVSLLALAHADERPADVRRWLKQLLEVRPGYQGAHRILRELPNQ